MSLLMEALKKAEEAKRLGGMNQSVPLSPTVQAASAIAHGKDKTTNPSGDSPLPNLSQHIDAVDAGLAAVSTASPIRQPSPVDREAAERTAARNLFAAKQAPGSSTGLWLIGGAGDTCRPWLGRVFLVATPRNSVAQPHTSDSTSASDDTRPSIDGSRSWWR